MNPPVLGIDTLDTVAFESSTSTTSFVSLIVENERFEKNLHKHRMKDQIKALEIQKKEIKFKILDIRKKAIFKIGLGVLIVAFALRNFIIPDERIDGSVLIITHHYMSKKDIGVICLIAFSVWYYFSNKKKKE